MWVCDRSVARLESHYENGCSSLVYRVGSGLCDELITRSKSYRVSVCECVCVIVCDLDT